MTDRQIQQLKELGMLFEQGRVEPQHLQQLTELLELLDDKCQHLKQTSTLKHQEKLHYK